MNNPGNTAGDYAISKSLSDTANSNQQRKAGHYTADDVLWEIKERRTHTGKHFHMRNGTNIAVAYNYPVHYINSNGEFEEIDNRLELFNEDGTLSTTQDESDIAARNGMAIGLSGEVAADKRVFKNTAGLANVQLAISGGAEKLANISYDGFTVSLTPRAMGSASERKHMAENGLKARECRAQAVGKLKQKAPDIDETSFETKIMPRHLKSSVVYDNIFDDTNIEYVVGESSLKENIIIAQPQTTYEYDFVLDTDGLTPVMQEKGSIDLRNKEGKSVFFIPAGYMFDANGNGSNAVTYELDKLNNDKYLLTVIGDAAWINAEGRVFPVTIDPPVEITGFYNIETSTLNERYPNGEGGQQATEELGYFSATGKNCRMLVHVNTLPELPDNSYVVFSGIYLYEVAYSDLNMSTLRIQAHPLTYNSPIDGYWCLHHSWNSCPSLGNVVDWTDVYNGRQFYGWNITREIIKWYNDPSCNYGLCLKASKEGSMYSTYCANVAFASSNTTNGGARPYLVVEYRNCVGLEDYYTHQSHSVRRAGTGYIGDYSGQLTFSKGITSSASTVNPVDIALVYNSAYSDREFTIFEGGSHTYPDLKLGHGWKLNIQQTMGLAEEGYLMHVDADGTTHFFYGDGTAYRDEDGLGLSVTMNGETYTMTDKKDNISYFENRRLKYVQDANGNRITFMFNSLDQITSVVRQNTGASSETIATFAYDANNYLISVTDSANNVTSFTHNSSNQITGITHPDGTSVSYEYNSNNKLIAAKDNESAYEMHYEYNANTGKVSKFYEKVGTETGVVVEAGGGFDGIQTYRHCGPGRVLGDADDIISHHVLDYFGRTTGTYTTNADMTKIYGASCSKYSTNADTSATNNRVLISSATGTQSINLLVDADIEDQTTIGSDTTPWVFTGDGTASIATDVKRTGLKALKLVREQTDTASVFKQTVSGLSANAWYILSAYANTGAVTTFGSTGKVFIRGVGAATVEGTALNWNTGGVGDGWERIYAIAQANASGAITLEAVASDLAGTVYFDDLQLEESILDASGSPGPASIVADGDMSKQNVWTSTHSGKLSYTTDSVFGKVAKVQGTAYDNINVYQDIQVNQPGNKTYLLSGWAKASSVPLRTSGDARAYGLSAEIYYEGETTAEIHSESFNVDNENWQYLCMPIVPKTPEKTVEKIRVLLNYGRNPNTAHFTKIAFCLQDAQSYKYNDDGDLVSVTSSENEEQTFSYNGADLISQLTQGNGTYEYEYDDKHNMIKATNDGVSMDVTYDTKGNTTASVLSAENTAEKICTSAVYSANGDLLQSQTDARGNTLSYDYDNPINKQTAQPSAVTDARGVTRRSVYNAANGRINSTGITDTVSLAYTYSDGKLSAMQRTGSGKTQTYTMGYSGFGGMTGVNVGNRTLASYTYGNGNGLMQRMTYGNGVTVDYSYDALERMSALYYNGANAPAATYAYAANGSLGRMQDNLANRSYNYNYDTLGRLISMVEKAGTAGTQRMRAGYDTSNRLVSMEYALSPALTGVFGDAKEYGYTYNDVDGSLTSMTLPGNGSYTYTYDALKRLTARQLKKGDAEVVTRNYSYLPGAGENETTLMVSGLTNTRGEEVCSQFAYKYDEAGNILSITSTRNLKEKLADGTSLISTDNESTYVYDEQGQLIKEYSYSRNPANDDRDAYVLNYTYDANGNLLSWGDKDEPFVLSYDDENWPDLLTAFRGNAITYDAIGNPLHWYDGTDFTWANGRRLASAVNTDTGLNVSYTYNVNGLRMTKTVNGVEHKYIWQGTKLVSEHYDGKTLEFFYDESGKPYAMSYKEGETASPVMYYYITNLQGDVISLVDAEGFSVAEYHYNAWGLPMGTTGAMAEINPLRYRGYYYDTDSGWYYLNGRYYVPFVCRFICSDTTDVLNESISLYDKNFYSYCDNNPITRGDSSGAAWHLIIGAGVGIATQYFADIALNLIEGKSFIESLHIRSSYVDYGAAALSGALAASGIGVIGAVVANAGIGATTYLANSDINGENPTIGGLVSATAIAGVSGRIGGAGANGAKVTGIVKTSQRVLSTTSSTKKVAMYSAKIRQQTKEVAVSTVRTVIAGIISNAANWVRQLFN